MAQHKSHNMQEGESSQQGRSYYTWSQSDDANLYEILLCQIAHGHKPKSSYTNTGWRQIVRDARAKINKQLSKDNIKNRLKTLKSSWIVMKNLVEHSDFNYDSNTKMVKADESTWQDYLVHHKEASKYRYCPLKDYDILCTLFSESTPSGANLVTLNEDHSMPKVPLTNNHGVDDEPMHVNPNVGFGSEQSSPSIDTSTTSTPRRRTREMPEKRRKNTLNGEYGSTLDALINAVVAKETQEKPNKRKECFDIIKRWNLPPEQQAIAAEFFMNDIVCDTFTYMDEESRHIWFQWKLGGHTLVRVSNFITPFAFGGTNQSGSDGDAQCRCIPVRGEEIPSRVESLIEELRTTRNEFSSLRSEFAIWKASRVESRAYTIGSPETRVLIENMIDFTADSLKAAAEYLVNKLNDPSVVVLGSCPGDGKVNLAVACSPKAIELGIQASKLIGPLAKLCGGGDGGRPNFAQACGKKPEKLPKALEMAKAEVAGLLSKSVS